MSNSFQNDHQPLVPSPPASVVDGLRDAINSHDPERVAGFFTSDYRCERPLHPDEGFVGASHVLENWTAILSRLPDLRAAVLRRAEDDEESWSEWEMTGTDADGARVVLRGPVILTTRDQKIDWTRFYVDPVGPLGGPDPRRVERPTAPPPPA